MKKLLLLPIAIALTSCGYDCPSDYNGWKVVDYNQSPFSNMTLQKGCEFKNVDFPIYYRNNYELGDTIGKATAADKNRMKYDEMREDMIKAISE